MTPQKGTTHWGWYWKVKKRDHNPKTLCSSLPSIDSFRLLKERKKRTFLVPAYQLTAILEKDGYRITYGKKGKSSYTIPFEKQDCNYGGNCYFFRCPLCQRRMRKLYFANGAFLCRKCLNLSYHSQRLRPEDRFGIAKIEIEKYIKRREGDLGLGIKPPRMHRKTFEKLKDRAEFYDAKSGLALYSDLRQWYGSKMESLSKGLEYEWEYTIDEYKQKYMRKKH